MKGILIAGGTGTRLMPLTRYLNKHLLPVGRLPMILHAVGKLEQAGVRDIRLITGKHSAGLFMQLLGSGSEWNVSISYSIQEEAGGISQALGLAEDFIKSGEKFVVMLGDNLFKAPLAPFIHAYQSGHDKAMVLLKEVDDPRRYGVPVFNGNRIAAIEEKPMEPQSNYCVPGIYFYDSSVFDAIKQIQPSARGEMEITDVNNVFAKNGSLGHALLDGWWVDAGTFESLYEASNLLMSVEDV